MAITAWSTMAVAVLTLGVLSPDDVHGQQQQARQRPGAGAQEMSMSRASGRPARASIGFALNYTLSAGPQGLRVTDYPVVSQVDSGSNAERAGLVVGDVVLGIDDRDSRNSGLVTPILPGQSFTVRVRRAGSERRITIVAGAPRARPER